jgi:hypothetical protein
MFFRHRILRCYKNYLAPESEAAARDGRLFENQILAGSNAMRPHMRSVNLTKAMRTFWPKRTHAKGPQFHCPMKPVNEAMLAVAKVACDAAQNFDPYESKLKSLESIRHMKPDDFGVQNLECDMAWIVEEEGNASKANDTLLTLLKQAGSKFAWTNSKAAHQPFVAMTDLAFAANYHQVAVEIGVAGTSVPYKLLQLEKDLQLMKALCRESPALPAFVPLPVVFVNVDEAEATRGLSAAHGMIRSLTATGPAGDSKPLIAQHDVLVVYTPFRNVYAKIEELNIKMDTKFGQLETKFGQLDTKIGHLETKFGQLETNMTAGFEKLSRAISRLAGKKSRRVSSPPKK